MDKLLLAAFLSSLAGFITAVLSVVKLVNEKENKISEFRQAWNNSIRTSISDLAAKLTSMTAALDYQKRLTLIENKLTKQTGAVHEKRLEMIRATLLRVREDITLHRHDQYQSYAQCKLHFKPNDPDFKPIEEIINLVIAQNKAVSLIKYSDESKAIRNKNYELIQNMVESSRSILKNVWDKVKEGEDAYKATKKYSFFGGIVLLVILVLIGGYALFLATRTIENTLNGSTATSKNEIKADITYCWKLQNFGKRMFKLNSCTGEIVELGNSPKS